MAEYNDLQPICKTCETRIEAPTISESKSEENVTEFSDLVDESIQSKECLTSIAHISLKKSNPTNANEDKYTKLLEDGTNKLLTKKTSSTSQSSTGNINPGFQYQEGETFEGSNTDTFDLNSKMSFMPKRSKIDLQFTDISFRVENGWKKGSKTILNRISGRFHSGQMNAILGHSGSGKSTMINILSGFRTSNVSGNVLINGEPRCLKLFRKQSCYIMQDDHLLQYLTVQESMQTAVYLRLGNNISESEKLTLIKEIAESLKLKDCFKTRVSNLSGGEKKRLSIALELANNPPVMFLDEPTSGLDSQNSYYCISILKNLAESGRNIICSIHQPSARLFEMFDYVYALAEGQCIYKGTIPQLVPFLLSMGHKCPPYHNPSDFLTTATEERNFSKLKLIKTYLRSRMSQQRLNSLATIST